MSATSNNERHGVCLTPAELAARLRSAGYDCELAELLAGAPAPAEGFPPVTAEEIDGWIDADCDLAAVPQGRGILPAAPAPYTSNTGATSSHTAAGGVDWLELSLYVAWDLDFDKVWARLEKAACAARAANAADASIRFGGLPAVLVKPAGCRHGVTYCPLVFDYLGCHVAVAACRRPGQQRANLYFRAPGDACLAYGAAWLVGQLRELIGAMGGIVSQETVSRVDLCIDRPDERVDEYCEARTQRRVVCRADYSGDHQVHHEYTGVTFGRGDVVARVYDKAVEAKGDEWKTRLLAERCWGKECEHAARVEFQFRRDVLRKMDVDTVDELFLSLPNLVEWATTAWLRLTDERPDRANKHQARFGASELWQSVQQQFREVFGQPIEWRKAPEVPAPLPVKLLRQAAGCIATAAVSMGRWPESTGELAALIGDFMRSEAGRLMDSLFLKRRKYEAQKAALAFLSEVPY